CFFNHSIHVQKGIGCATCHGRVDRMPLVWQEKTLLMEWCLDCHRQPEKYVRPREKVFDMAYERTDPDEGSKLVDKYNIKSKMSCSTCHRRAPTFRRGSQNRASRAEHPMKRRIDLDLLRDRLSVAQGKRYWRSLEELAAHPDFEEMLHREFP